LFEVDADNNPAQPSDKTTVQVMYDNDLCYCGSGKLYIDCHKDYDERKRTDKMQAFK